ncbi:MAG TPA: carbon storage regulator CsrA [Negativicutes bacterium]|nr:carbon storage regulator CsrA [Negativicutes bacterium]
MLVLTRKPGEKIFIGDNMSLTVVEVKGDSVRIAVDAPREVKIYRGEIYEAIIAENKAAVIAGDMKQLDGLKKLK